MAEEYLKNNTIPDSVSPIGIFSNTQLVADINRSKKLLHLSNNLVSKINQMQKIVPDYGKVWYDEKAMANIFSLT